MDIHLEPGTYVLAVSGGVDSMVLLDLLQKKSLASDVAPWKLIVAHFDHGIRDDSHLDRKIVQDIARQHGLQFIYDEGNLGWKTSEDAARQARYGFLHKVRKASGAKAVVVAHHQDDLLETAIHNMLRGTGRRGLVALRNREHIHRPLLNIPKTDLVAYAKDQGLLWREDSTNSDLRYRRNYIRYKVLTKMSYDKQQELLQHIRNLYSLDIDLENELVNHLHIHPATSELNRHWFIMLPHNVAREVMLAWLRRHGVQDLTKKTIERLITAAKTYPVGKLTDVDKTHAMQVQKSTLALITDDR